MSTDNIPKIVLGSRSPRRRELLSSVVGDNRLVILPPTTPHEPGFSDVSDEAAIERRLCEIVGLKYSDVCCQADVSQQTEQSETFIVVADTIVIADGENGTRHVLGQPDPDKWQDDVRTWFRRWLSGRTHDVWTGVRISRGKESRQFVVRSGVTFRTVNDDLLNWYLSTGESLGKAGGYAIQGHAAAFVTGLDGSLTNVIGLPVLEVLEGLTELGWLQSER
jgi:septum formation protein